jgi:hypothetical protein
MLHRGHDVRQANRARYLSRRLILPAVAVLGLSLLAAPARAGGTAGTKVTIQVWHGGVFGYVQSTRPGRCAAGRSVAVLSRQGKRSKRIGTATARRRHGGYQWSIKTKRSGELFAMASRRPGCRSATSAAIAPTANRNGVPNCPSNEAVCYFPNMHGDMVEFAICPGFSKASGSCSGSSEGGVSPWSPNDKAIFGWQGSADGFRNVSYYAKYSVDDEHTAVAADLGGSVPGPNSADFTITDAADPHGPADTKDTHWYTPDVAGAAAGTQGGPLYLDFENGSWGFDIYIHGYLYKK